MAGAVEQRRGAGGSTCGRRWRDTRPPVAIRRGSGGAIFVIFRDRLKAVGGIGLARPALMCPSVFPYPPGPGAVARCASRGRRDSKNNCVMFSAALSALSRDVCM